MNMTSMVTRQMSAGEWREKDSSSRGDGEGGMESSDPGQMVRIGDRRYARVLMAPCARELKRCGSDALMRARGARADREKLRSSVYMRERPRGVRGARSKKVGA